MLKQHWRLVTKLEQLGDNFIISLMFFIAYYFRDFILILSNHIFNPISKEILGLGPLKDYVIVMFIALLLYNVFLAKLGAYRSMRFLSFMHLLKIVFMSSVLVFMAEASLLYLIKLDLSRSFLAIFCFMSGIGLLVERFLTLKFLRYFRIKGMNFRNLLIVGDGKTARKAYLEMSSQPELGIRVKGFISLGDKEKSEILDLPSRLIGDSSNFETALKRHAIDEVLFTEVVKNFHKVRRLASIAVEEGVSVSLVADFFSIEILKSDISYFGTIPLIHYQPFPATPAALVIKRIIDIGFSSFLLILLSPLLIITAILIKLDSEGDVLFKQRRVGLNGRIFTLLKFRSMEKGAHRKLRSLKKYNEMRGPAFKMKDDPRITRVGRFIRKYSIDELPQLINVLKGDMSLVGPRPPIPNEVSEYLRKHRRRLSMRPGLTCTWQISGRNKIPDFEKWTELDLEYIDNWSLKKDLILILKTIPAVFFAKGAR